MVNKDVESFDSGEMPLPIIRDRDEIGFKSISDFGTH
jgi:hypothetical protein